MKRFFTLLMVSIVATLTLAQEVQKETYTFAERDNTPLYLDVYSTSEEVQPCLLYIFGGAFLMGSRDEPSAIETYEYFAQRGWKVVAIDYRLGLKPLRDEPEVERGLLEFRKMLLHSIDIATEDLIDATLFVVENAESLGIDPERIVTLGSSAGAITACQAEWAICNNQEVASALPEGFNYAGVISMAGAICSPTRKLKWEREPCPMLLFHGDADSNVPYGRQSLFGVSLIGSEKIAESLENMGSPYWFYDAENVDHWLAWWPLFLNREEMERFAERMVFGGEKLQIHQKVKDCNLPDKEDSFGLKDYIKSNFTPPAEN